MVQNVSDNMATIIDDVAYCHNSKRKGKEASRKMTILRADISD